MLLSLLSLLHLLLAVRMFSDLRLLTFAVVVLIFIGVVSKGRAFIGHHGLFTMLVRHLTGHTWTGTHLTDAGWFRPATDKPAKTNTGHTRRFWYRPRAHRMARRDARYGAAVLLLLMWKDYPFWEACLITAAIFAGACAWAAWLIRRWWRERDHYRKYVKPLHLVASRQVGIPAAADPRSWLTIAPDRSLTELEFPQGYNPSPDDRKRLVETVGAKLGLEDPEPDWMLAGPRPRLALRPSVSSPASVPLAAVRAEFDRVKPDELVWGLGKHGALITTSLAMDSPHVGLSIGSGGGKSRAARNLLGQMLYRGSLGIILDVKQLSQHWTSFGEQLPNVYVARELREIHNVLLWLAVELARRNREGLKHADIEGNVPPGVLGPRVIIVGEELNATVKYLRGYWREIRTKDDPARSPALNALDALSFMGRQVSMNIVFIGQRLSVAGTGGDGDSKENIGTIALGRYSPSNWRMNASDFPMPPKSMIPGRFQIVTDRVQEVQGVDINGREARELALAGDVAAFPPGSPGARVIAGRAEGILEAHQGFVPITPGGTPAPVTGLVTLREAVERRIVDRTLGALHIARYRGQLPRHIKEEGGAFMYDPESLRLWDLESR